MTDLYPCLDEENVHKIHHRQLQKQKWPEFRIKRIDVKRLNKVSIKKFCFTC